MAKQDHWENVFNTKESTEVSWYQPHLALSLALIEQTGAGNTASVMDVGGGTSTLVDDLLARDYQHVTVLDISATALAEARRRLGEAAAKVQWLAADITQVVLPQQAVDVWHDRAVFHFLTSPEDQQRYVGQAAGALRSGGHLIVATFAEDGPTHCSGLEVMRYSAESLYAVFSADFDLIETRHELHQTPFNTQQHFVYCVCRKR